jgi:hypothetical protein
MAGLSAWAASGTMLLNAIRTAAILMNRLMQIHLSD